MALLRQYIFLAVLALAAQERPQVFRITPVRPVAELRAEALAARPPQERSDFLLCIAAASAQTPSPVPTLNQVFHFTTAQSLPVMQQIANAVRAVGELDDA